MSISEWKVRVKHEALKRIFIRSSEAKLKLYAVDFLGVVVGKTTFNGEIPLANLM